MCLIPTNISNSQSLRFKCHLLLYHFACRGVSFWSPILLPEHVRVNGQRKGRNLQSRSADCPADCPARGDSHGLHRVSPALRSSHRRGPNDTQATWYSTRATLRVVVLNSSGVFSSTRNFRGHLAHPKFFEWFLFKMLLSLGELWIWTSCWIMLLD